MVKPKSLGLKVMKSFQCKWHHDGFELHDIEKYNRTFLVCISKRNKKILDVDGYRYRVPAMMVREYGGDTGKRKEDIYNDLVAYANKAEKAFHVNEQDAGDSFIHIQYRVSSLIDKEIGKKETSRSIMNSSFNRLSFHHGKNGVTHGMVEGDMMVDHHRNIWLVTQVKSNNIVKVVKNPFTGFERFNIEYFTTDATSYTYDSPLYRAREVVINTNNTTVNNTKVVRGLVPFKLIDEKTISEIYKHITIRIEETNIYTVSEYPVLNNNSVWLEDDTPFIRKMKLYNNDSNIMEFLLWLYSQLSSNPRLTKTISDRTLMFNTMKKHKTVHGIFRGNFIYYNIGSGQISDKWELEQGSEPDINASSIRRFLKLKVISVKPTSVIVETAAPQSTAEIKEHSFGYLASLRKRPKSPKIEIYRLK